jgi:DNA-binding NarL/FixJ family response regulator
VVQAIRAMSQGRSFLTRKVTRILQEDYVSRLQQRGLQDRYDLLSDREPEVLQMIAEARST